MTPIDGLAAQAQVLIFLHKSLFLFKLRPGTYVPHSNENYCITLVYCTKVWTLLRDHVPFTSATSRLELRTLAVHCP